MDRPKICTETCIKNLIMENDLFGHKESMDKDS